MIALQGISSCKKAKSSVDILSSGECIKILIENKEWASIEGLLKNSTIPSRQKENAICLQDNDTGTNTVMGAIEAGAPFEVIKLMIDHAPYIINSKDSNAWNLLHYGCYFDTSHEIIQFIIDKATPEIFEKNKSGMNPLHLACRHCTSIEIARIIMRAVPNICSIPDGAGCNPLHLALQLNANIDLIELLISDMPEKAFFSKDNKGHDPFHYLCNHTEPEEVVRVIVRKPSPHVILREIENNLEILKFAAKELRDDDILAACAIKKNPHALEFASENVKSNRSIVLHAVEEDGDVLQFASDELRKDSTCELAAVESEPLALKFTSDETRNNHAIVLKALKIDGNALQFAGDELRKNKQIILVAVTTTPSSIRFALGGMDQDRECLLATGLWDSNPATDFSKPSIVMSCRMIPNENNYQWTQFGILMQENIFFNQFKVYHQNPWNMVSCVSDGKDPSSTYKGTLGTCKLKQENRAEKDRSWTVTVRSRMEKAKADGGIVIQVSEWLPSANNHILGPYQEIETEMAADVGIKVFRVLQNHRYGDGGAISFDHTHVYQVGEKILAWHKTGRKDMTMVKIHVV